MSALTQQKSEWDTGLLEKFRTLALRYQEIGQEAGIKIRPHRSADLPMFREATPEQRKTAVDSLENMVNIFEEMIAAGEKSIDCKKLLWRALKRFNLVPSPDLFSRMNDNDEIVIIYNHEHKIIFWTLQFFKVASFTVEEMFFMHWPEATRREEHIQQYLYKLAVDVVTGKLQGCFVPDVPTHEVEELNTLECIKTMMTISLVSVLTQESQFGGYLAIQQMEVIG